MNFKVVRHFKWEFLHAIEYQNEIAFSAFNKIIENQEIAYSFNNSELNGKTESDQYLNSLPQVHQESYFWASYGNEVHAIEDIRRFQRYSTCLILFSFFEEKLKTICTVVATEHKLEKFKNSESEYIESYWNYLTNVYGIDRAIKPYLEPILEQRFVRNKIAHQGGFLRKEQCKCFKEVQGVRLEEYGNEYQIIITDTIYLTYVTQKMDFFLKKLLAEVDKIFSK